ncbi:Chromosome initiation inhibitor [plant metagenome]|uniref:Chromosome initiation inhibitor n=1 Tax=plant metagenome TaxID=1297885 RepID=A0A484S5A6_9ZZZZ
MFLRKLTPSMPQLLAFEAAARHGNFTAAARELHLTQSAVSRHIQELESSLQADLFERVGRRVTLTPEGLRYAREIAGALARIRSASMEVYEARARAGALQLAVVPIFGSKWLMPRLGAFHARHPDVLVNVHSRIGEIDAALSGMDAYIAIGDGHWPQWVSHHLLDAPAVVIASPALLRRLPVEKPADLIRHPLLQITGHAPGWRECLLANGLDPRQVTMGSRFEYTAHLIQAVVGGMGLGLVANMFVQEELRAGSLVIPDIAGFTPPVKHYYLLYPPDRAELPTLQTFKTWLLEAAADASIRPLDLQAPKLRT